MTKVAVYGSLRKGMGNHRLLEGQTCLGETTTVQPYAMYSLGGFPKVVLGEPISPIVVEVYEVDDRGLARLDQLEGYYGPDRQNFYDRTEVETVGIGPAWIYHIEGENSRSCDRVSDGDWVGYKLKRFA